MASPATLLKRKTSTQGLALKGLRVPLDDYF